jgi:hypothetical protein
MLKRFSFWLNTTTLTQLKALAIKQDHSIGWLLNKAAMEYIKKQK